MVVFKPGGVLHPSFRKFRDQLLVMAPLAGLAIYFYGARPAIMLGIAITAAVLCDLAVALLRRAPYRPDDLSSIGFAVILTLMLPASCRYEIVLFGVLVSVLLGKHAFGGYGCYPFHPSAFGFAACALCFSDQIFSYPKPFSEIGIGLDSGAALFHAPAATLKLGGVPNISGVDLLLGHFNGPMGTTYCVVLLASLVLLLAHKEFTWHVPICFLGTVALWAFMFPRVNAGPLQSVVYELLAGSLLFAVVFIASEPVTAPSTPKAKIVYGILLGIETMLFSHYGAFQLGVCFAVLLANPSSSWLDRNFQSDKPLFPKSAKRKGAQDDG